VHFTVRTRLRLKTYTSSKNTVGKEFWQIFKNKQQKNKWTVTKKKFGKQEVLTKGIKTAD